MTAEHFDVLIVGAGLSGVGAAWRLQEELPGATYAILERRDAIGGTWDLFRYPGVRSDSDMFTLTYPFRPWRGDESMASGENIRTYIRETADSAGITEQIRFGTRVVRSPLSSETGRWTVETETAEGAQDLHGVVPLHVRRLLRLRPGLPAGVPRPRGLRRHVGAPAVLAGGPRLRRQEGCRDRQRRHRGHADPGHGDDAEHVTMLQRSPSYLTVLPERDPAADRLRKLLPPKAAHALLRMQNVTLTQAFYQLARRRPERVKKSCAGWPCGR